jgi:hypothetical protein
MTTHVTITNPVRSDVPTTPGSPTRAGTRARGWKLAGIGAGLAGIGTVVSSSLVNAVYDEKLFGNPEGMADKLADQTIPMVAFHTFTVVGALLAIVFAAGLHRRLRAGAGEHSTAPLVAFAGLVGTAVVSIIGSGLDTEFMFGIPAENDMIEPVNAVMYNHWIGTVPWCWVLAGLAGLAVHLVARAGGAPRWLGRVGLVLGGLTLLLGISPFQYMAGATGPLWLLVTAIGFTVGDRVFRAAR